MSKVRVLVLRAPGTNCDAETAFAFEQAGATSSLVHINRFIRNGQRLADYQVLVIPAGKVLANELRLGFGEDIRTFIDNGGLILGICNGFQVLVKAGILPGNTTSVTLTDNDSGRFECRWVHLDVNGDSPCVFTRGIEAMSLPVAHAEGKIVIAGDSLPDSLMNSVTATPDIRIIPMGQHMTLQVSAMIPGVFSH